MSLLDPITGLFGLGNGSAVKAGQALTPPAPTAGTTHPARPATPAPAAAAPAGGNTKLLPFIIGAGLAFALADTRAAPIVIAVLVGAIIFQLVRATSAPTTGR